MFSLRVQSVTNPAEKMGMGKFSEILLRLLCALYHSEPSPWDFGAGGAQVFSLQAFQEGSAWMLLNVNFPASHSPLP